MALKHSDYTIAWICALPLEMAAAKTMLDAIHPPPTQPETDHNVYTLGSVSGHNVAIACLPSGVYGTTSAAIVLAHMLPTFLSLRFALMVGIGGGVPSKKDIRLGDVVVSMPAEGFGGVIQYDYGKTLSDGKLHRTGSLNKPPHYLLTAMSKIRCDFISDELTIKTDISKEHLENQKIHKQFLRPAEDQLFMSSYIHRNDNPDCSQCDLSHLMTRPPRESVEPMVHYGLIASGNRVMRDAKTRDAIAKDIDILCFEMEAAGLMDQLPCLVIRGICDYSDSHKNKTWQGYASLTAAAYAKLLLEVLPQTQGYQLMKEEDFTREEEACLQGLFVTDPVEDKSSLNRRKGDRAKGTCEWILETEELRRWLGDLEEDHDERASDILWLHGYPGTGKSTIAMAMADQIPKQYSFANRDKVLAYFFCDSSAEKQRTAISVLRGLLYHLIQQCPWLIKCALPKFLHRKEALFLSFDALWSIFLEIAKSSSSGIYCIIDALDECERDSQEILLGQISQTFPARRKEGVSSRHPRILITSRPYDEIRQSLSNFRCKDLATYSALKNDLALMIHEKVADLTRRKSYPPRVVKEVSQILEQKAEGTFLWVGIACSELAQPQIQARNTIKALQKMPRGLNSMYKQLLSAALAYSDDDDDDDRANILLMLKVVTTARRPLSVRELADMCQLYSDYDESTRFQFTMDDIGRCRLMIIVQDERVQLLHKSVNDFLVKERRAFDVKPSHAELADRCIINLLNESSRGAIFEYAVTYWPEHTKLAADAFTVMKHHELFFEPRSPTWELWAIQYNSQNRWLSRPLDEGFSVLHAAARWDVVPLLTWAFAKGSGLSLAETPYDDQLFQTVTGITPLEEAARSGSIRITEEVVMAAARNQGDGKRIMKLLLDQQGDHIQITEDVVTAAAGNKGDGQGIMALLLDRQGDQIQVTKEVVMAAARNQGDGKRIMKLLLDQQGDHIRITEDVVRAAAGNKGHGQGIMALLLGQQGDHIQITEELFSLTDEATRFRLRKMWSALQPGTGDMEKILWHSSLTSKETSSMLQKTQSRE
ncbi:hypothetical protein BJX63DRAFT_441534 [Aspergillus granulosus]|uniref:Nucleoside phosphorylase domain-containing protein n=1 Tax=Aspergillus granulosus TaxID=176169 RepID=A0ABR4GSE0_9EURO